jgi:hypothetical protein
VAGRPRAWLAANTGLLAVTRPAPDADPTDGARLDLGTGVWTPFPAGPRQPQGWVGPGAATGARFLVLDGWVLDTATATWVQLDRPDGATDTGLATAWVGDQLFVWGAGVNDREEGQLVVRGWLRSAAGGRDPIEPTGSSPAAGGSTLDTHRLAAPPSTPTGDQAATPPGTTSEPVSATPTPPPPATPPALLERGTFQGTDHYTPTTSGPCALEHTVELTVTAPEGPAWAYRADVCGHIDAANVWTGIGPFTLTAPDGDTLVGTVDSTAQLPSNGEPYLLRVNGGTGSLAGTTGTCRIDNHQRQASFGLNDQWGSFSCALDHT